MTRPGPARRFPAGRPGYREALLALPSGERARVVELGPASAPAAVLLHGWGSSAFSWRETMPALAARGWRAVAIELRGHGGSDKPADAAAYTHDAMVGFVLATMDAAGVGRAVVVGHSLGGELAVALALRAPDRVERLVLVAPVGFGDAWLVPLGRLLTPRPVLPLLPMVMRRWVVRLAMRVATGGRRAWPDEVIDEYWAPSADPGYAWAVRHLLHGARWIPPTPEALASLRAPALVIFGTRDRLILARDAERLARGIPQATFAIVKGAGHVVPEEAPERLNPLLLDFLEPAREALGGAAASGA